MARAHPREVASARIERSLLDLVSPEPLDRGDLARALRVEEETVRSDDEAYWRPLKQMLSRMRREPGPGA